jgi:hypothetical protein
MPWLHLIVIFGFPYLVLLGWLTWCPSLCLDNRSLQLVWSSYLGRRIITDCEAKPHYQSKRPRKCYIYSKANWEALHNELSNLSTNIKEMCQKGDTVQDLWSSCKKELFASSVWCISISTLVYQYFYFGVSVFLLWCISISTLPLLSFTSCPWAWWYTKQNLRSAQNNLHQD